MKFDLKAVPTDLVKVNEYGELKVVKYAKKVFYKNLWNTHPLVVECRGLVLDTDNNIVSYPFTKVFNIGENNTEYPEFPFTLVDKVNGFLGVLTRHNGEFIFSTTGSLNSPFVGMWRESFHSHWEKHNEDSSASLDLYATLNHLTLMFEVCHPDDPHIVKEEPGIYLIGARHKCTLRMLLEIDLDHLATAFKWKRPKHRTVRNQEELDALVNNCKMEGFMVRDRVDNIVAKVKSPHYLGTKFLARGGAKKSERLWGMTAEQLFKCGLEEEFFGVVQNIRKEFTQEEWTALDEQSRICFIETVLGMY